MVTIAVWVGVAQGIALFLAGWLLGRFKKPPSATEQSDCPQVPLQYKLEPRRCTHQQWAWAQIPVCQTCLAVLPWPYPTTAAAQMSEHPEGIAQVIEPPVDTSSNPETADDSLRVVRLTPSGTPYLWVVEP